MKLLKPPTITIEEIKRRKGKVYRLYIRYTNKDGVRVRERKIVADTLQKAKNKKKDIQDEFYRNGNMLDLEEKATISLRALIDEYKNLKNITVAGKTKSTYKNHFEKFYSFISDSFPSCNNDINILEHKHVVECITHYKNKETKDKKWSDRTVNNFIVNLKSLFNYAFNKGYISKSPFADIKRKKLPAKGRADFYTDVELTIILNAIRSHYKNAIEFIVNTGLRKGELINLTWENVSETKVSPFIEIKSSNEWDTKTKNARIINLNKRALQIIKEQKEKNEKYVFTSPLGSKVHPDRILEALKKALPSDIKGDIHKLRHTFGSKLAMKGVPLYTISQLMGHTLGETTMLYAHLSPAHIQDAVDKIIIKKK